MNVAEYKNIYDHEATHFFYRSTHDLIIRFVKNLQVSKKTKVLDVGCGTGLLVKKLSHFTDAEGVDSHPNAVRFSKKRNIKVKKGSMMKLPYAAKAFDIVTCIDVLCHAGISNDLRALSEVNRILKPNGAFIIRVPAHKFLYSKHDKYVCNKKRYEYKSFIALLQKAGFSVSYYSYVNLSLLLPSYIKTINEKNSSDTIASVVSSPNKMLNNLVYWLVSMEAFFTSRHIQLPFGIELLAVCNKKLNY